MKLKVIAAGMVLLFICDVSLAGEAPEQNAGQFTAKSGQATVVRKWWRCTGDLPAISSAAAEHGTMSLGKITENHCGKPNQPVLALTYTPEAGFKGVDTGYFYFTRWRYRMSITVE